MGGKIYPWKYFMRWKAWNFVYSPNWNWNGVYKLRWMILTKFLFVYNSSIHLLIALIPSYVLCYPSHSLLCKRNIKMEMLMVMRMLMLMKLMLASYCIYTYYTQQYPSALQCKSGKCFQKDLIELKFSSFFILVPSFHTGLQQQWKHYYNY